MNLLVDAADVAVDNVSYNLAARFFQEDQTVGPALAPSGIP